MNQKMEGRKQVMVPTLPKAFIFTAFVNFFVGTLFGATMSVKIATASVLAPLHAILNPYGWLTMLIYGMTFAVLSFSLGVKLPTRWQGPLQWVIAEAGIIVAVVGHAASLNWMATLGAVLLAFAPIIFLVNILSGVIYTKRLRPAPTDMESNSQALYDHPHDGFREGDLSSAASILRLFGRRAEYRETDRVGQRGTDISLMLFIVTAVWAAIASVTGVTANPLAQNWLVYYGWIGGTVLSVAIHLAPRFVNRKVPLPKLTLVLQVLWFGGILIAFLTNLFDLPSFLFTIGQAAVGASLALYSVLFIAHAWEAVRAKNRSSLSDAAVAVEFMGPPAVVWVIGWGFACLLGVQLVIGINPFSLTSIHFLFLGFITNLVFSVGYTVFPLILHCIKPARRWMGVQLTVFTIGVVVLIESFSRLEAGYVVEPWLAVGGTLTMAGVFLFFLFWLGSPRPRNSL